ncbi:histidine phosphatase family protein [Bilifractor sp. HCP3S3_D3]|uniref:histidine phosphatase family protein n=1 Tax=Bilifractor sp. HCP3S3_D3 TaxID=3438907 RepID=UPI003F89CCD1
MRIHEGMMELVMIRHGRTKGNMENRYIGTTDEPLLASEAEHLLAKRETLEEMRMDHPDILLVSPMRRCLETAAILFPESEPVIVPDFRECDFGEFENKNYKELSGNVDYQRWIDSGGRLPFPGGESMSSFQERVCRAFDRVVREASEHLCGEAGIAGGASEYLCGETGRTGKASEEAQDRSISGTSGDPVIRAAMVVHGGTIMAVLEKYGYPRKSYFEWHVGNGDGFLLSVRETGDDLRLSVRRGF